MKRRTLCLFTAFCVGFLASCGNNQTNETTENPVATDEEISESEAVSAKERPQKNGFDEKTSSEVQLGNVIFSVPSYFEADITEDNHYRAYAEKGGDTAYIEIFASVDEEDPTPVSYEAFVENIESGKTKKDFEAWFDSCDGVTTIPFETESIKGFVLSTDYTKDNYTGYCQCLSFPSVDNNAWFYVILNQTDGTDYSYTDDFRKMLHSIKMDKDYQEVACGGVVFLLPGDFEFLTEDERGVMYGWEKEEQVEAVKLSSDNMKLTDEEFKQKKEAMFSAVNDTWNLSSEIREKEIAGLQAFEAEYILPDKPDYGKTHVLFINNPMQGQRIVVLFSGTVEIGERVEKDFQEICDSAYIEGTDYNSQEEPSGVDPDFKAFLDSYESFVDEYVDFMKSYLDDPANAISMVSEYTEMIARLEDYDEKINAYDTDEMSEADLNYYLEVTSRCSKKMLSVGG